MKKKKLIISSTLMVLTLGLTAVAGVLSFGKEGVQETAAKGNSYNAVIDATHQIVDSKIKTGLGNKITVKDNGVSFGTNITMGKGKYIQNTDPLHRISRIAVTLVSGKVQIQYGSKAPNELETPMFLAEEISETKDVIIEEDFDVNYFRIIASEDSEISKIDVRFNCSNLNNPFEVNANHAYENGYIYQNNTDGIVSFDTENAKYSDYCLRYDNVNPTANSNNPSLSIDVNKSIEEGLITDIPDTVTGLCFDIKDDNDVMKKDYNNRNGTQIQILDNTSSHKGLTGWLGAIDWCGGRNLGDGWYKAFYSFDAISKEDIGAIKLIFNRTNNSGEMASTYWIDNVQLLGSQSIKGSGYNPTNSNPTFTIEWDSKVAPTMDENKVAAYYAVDYRLPDGNTDAQVYMGNSGAHYFGWYTIQDGVSNYKGVKTEKLGDGYYRLKVAPGFANPSGNRNFEFKTLGAKQTIAPVNFHVVYDDEITLNSDQEWNLGRNVSVIDNESMTFEYKVDNGGNTALRAMMYFTGDAKYVGTFDLTSELNNDSYKGVKVENLADGYKKVTFKFDELNRAHGAWGTLKSQDIGFFNTIRQHASWGDRIPISIRNISIKPFNYDDFLEGTGVTASVYIDALDHDPVQKTPVTSGVTVTKETENVVAGSGWKITANVDSECWDWVLFDLKEELTISQLNSFSIKAINAQKWYMVRFYDENKDYLCDSFSEDFSGNDFYKAKTKELDVKGARYFGICLHFYAGSENIVYLDELKMNTNKDEIALNKNESKLFEFAPVGVYSGKTIVMTFKNITSNSIEDDIGLFLLKDSDQISNLNSNGYGFGKYCFEIDHTIYHWIGSGANHATGLTAIKSDNENKELVVSFDLEDIYENGTSRNGLQKTNSVSCIYFQGGIMLGTCTFSYQILIAD